MMELYLWISLGPSKQPAESGQDPCSLPDVNKQTGKERQLFLMVKSQPINVAGMTELDNHHLARISNGHSNKR